MGAYRQVSHIYLFMPTGHRGTPATDPYYSWSLLWPIYRWAVVGANHSFWRFQTYEELCNLGSNLVAINHCNCIKARNEIRRYSRQIFVAFHASFIATFHILFELVRSTSVNNRPRVLRSVSRSVIKVRTQSRWSCSGFQTIEPGIAYITRVFVFNAVILTNDWKRMCRDKIITSKRQVHYQYFMMSYVIS